MGGPFFLAEAREVAEAFSQCCLAPAACLTDIYNQCTIHPLFFQSGNADIGISILEVAACSLAKKSWPGGTGPENQINTWFSWYAVPVGTVKICKSKKTIKTAFA